MTTFQSNRRTLRRMSGELGVKILCGLDLLATT